jgi:phosphatidylglycerophosphatase GEP4
MKPLLCCHHLLWQSDRSLALPHLAVADLRWVDWAALAAAGFQGCVFDKDNTLTGKSVNSQVAAGQVLVAW